MNVIVSKSLSAITEVSQPLCYCLGIAQTLNNELHEDNAMINP